MLEFWTYEICVRNTLIRLALIFYKSVFHLLDIIEYFRPGKPLSSIKLSTNGPVLPLSSLSRSVAGLQVSLLAIKGGLEGFRAAECLDFETPHSQ